jgi:hypothetical protein
MSDTCGRVVDSPAGLGEEPTLKIARLDPIYDWMLLGLRARDSLPCFWPWRNACQPLFATQDRPYCERTVAPRAPSSLHPLTFGRICAQWQHTLVCIGHCPLAWMLRASALTHQGRLAGTRSSSSSSFARIITTPRCPQTRPIRHRTAWLPLPGYAIHQRLSVATCARVMAAVHELPPKHFLCERLSFPKV